MSVPREMLLLLLFAAMPAVVSGFLQIAIDETEGVGTADVAEGEVLLEEVLNWDSVLWVDARPAAQYEAGHIPGAVPLREEHWDELLGTVFDSWDPERMIVVYCASESCGTSARVAERLRREVGLENVFVLKGGWEAWQAQR